MLSELELLNANVLLCSKSELKNKTTSVAIEGTAAFYICNYCHHIPQFRDALSCSASESRIVYTYELLNLFLFHEGWGGGGWSG